MSFLYVQTPDGKEHRHAPGGSQPQLEVEELEDGSLQILSISETPSIRRPGLGTIHQGGRTVDVVEAYPPGSTWEWR